MVHAATLLAGRYVLDEPIGAGGYCEVWRATDTVLTRQVAVKLLHAGYASQGEALARFKAEARHAGALSHENIARVYDFGEPADGQSYLVMELVDGPLAVAVLTLAALTCLVLISVTGFASGSHPAESPSHTPSRAPSQAAPAITASPTATAPPGQRHHNKSQGNGNGNGNGQ